jgi:hypothetical protein
MTATLPGNFAVPGIAWPGAAQPGRRLPVVLRLYQFNGPVQLVYPDYIDDLARHTLVASPGMVYDILPPATGLPAAPSDGRWTPTGG